MCKLSVCAQKQELMRRTLCVATTLLHPRSQKMQCVYVTRSAEPAANGSGNASSAGGKGNGAAAAAAAGVATQIKERMIFAAAHPEAEMRPFLLFPEVSTHAVGLNLFFEHRCCGVELVLNTGVENL